MPKDIIGPITPPPGFINDQPIGSALAGVFVFAIKLVFIIGGFLVLAYLIWGALDWLMSGGDKENLEKARKKMINALVGIFVLIFVFIVWITLTSSTFGIIERTKDGLIFRLPRLGK